LGWAAVRAARQAACLLEGAAEEVLDLGVAAAEVVRGPAVEGGEERRVEAQEERLLFGH
jgi:hypothetical protein